jgi:hypothetical protein
MPVRRATAGTDRRVAALERLAEAQQRLPDDARERDALLSLIPVPDREQLADDLEAAMAAGDDDRGLACMLRFEALLLVAQSSARAG